MHVAHSAEQQRSDALLMPFRFEHRKSEDMLCGASTKLKEAAALLETVVYQALITDGKATNSPFVISIREAIGQLQVHSENVRDAAVERPPSPGDWQLCDKMKGMAALIAKARFRIGNRQPMPPETEMSDVWRSEPFSPHSMCRRCAAVRSLPWSCTAHFCHCCWPEKVAGMDEQTAC